MRLPRYRFGEFELDPASRELLRRGERIALPPKSFECLVHLIANRNRAVGRDELISAVWGRVEVSDTVVAQTLLRARKALDDTGDRQSLIRTVPRFGYRWVAPVQEVAASVDTVSDDSATGAAAVALPDNEAMPTGNETPAAAVRARAPWSWLVLLLVAVVVAGWALHRYWPGARPGSAPQSHGNVALVLPVVVTPSEGEDDWVRLGAMDYLASRLRRSGLKVLPSDQAMHLSAQVGDSKPITADGLQKLQSISAAHWIVAPEALHDRQGWRMRLNLHEAGRQPQIIEARGATALTAAAAVSDSWLRRLGLDSKAREATPSPMVERVQQIDAELLAGQIANARRLIEGAPAKERDEPALRVREGQIEYRAGRIDEAAAIFQKVLGGQRAMTDGIRAKALMGQGAVEIRRGNFPAAESRYTEALTVLESRASDVDDPALLGNAYNGRGVARVQQGKMDAAVQDMGRARIAMQRSGNLIEAATVGSNLGQMETRRGHYSQALQEFDRAIAVFERFDVSDYLAVTLMSKAATQLQLVQPADAAASIQRADALVKTLEDPELTIRIATVRTLVLLANGRISAAAQSIAGLRALGVEETSPGLQELMLRLQLARNARTEAGALARHHPNAGRVPGSLALTAVQAALRNGDAGTARYWLSRSPTQGATTSDGATTSWDVARALVAQSEGRAEHALQMARLAQAGAERTGSPDDRVRTGLLQARLLLDRGQPDAAAAVLGDLDAFAASDYRVAWTTLALYRALGDPGMAANALERVQALRGERDIAVEPVL
ncbi:hypothetical protein GCM10027431_20190 [Lysobacter rhizosphaerae]